MDDSRLKRLLACLDDMAGSAVDADTAALRQFAGELPDDDPLPFQVRLAARFCDDMHDKASQLLRQLHEAGA